MYIVISMNNLSVKLDYLYINIYTRTFALADWWSHLVVRLYLSSALSSSTHAFLLEWFTFYEDMILIIPTYQ